MGDLLWQAAIQPTARVVTGGIPTEFGRRTSPKPAAKLRLRDRDTLGAIDLREAAGEHRLGLVIERTDELRLPPVPDARTHRLDVGHGEDGEQFHALDRLHHLAEIF